ncbi:MAG: aminotransferase class V-fold PLP-dependent enzyme [Gammaproteobacteria bacterium]|nr:aminotransferase class V-fold PLP-dependent enzyme [Gammaproteobacteria bacterium]MDP6616288.1 aminotransferase class V-fold PLP-dependent enzyme [Gammaproteobacteria bacterium]MDP6694002.1 aminotransferase class V-fold PLP-dependent enzyme [Gammaproteobacteria bacterium]MDP7041072.1 aminotransferase class V-fold PLP-dependent enzyme [Gammaproteobacteria bacterium]
MTGEVIYLDYAASSPVDPRVREQMDRWLDNRSGFGNPSSTHRFGVRAAAAVDEAAAAVAALVNAVPAGVVWTSGATESDNLAIIGAAQFRRMRGQHVVSVLTEHKAVLESCAYLETQGFEVTLLQPDESGLVSPEEVAAALRPDTVLVSVMHANNEIGVVQDIGEIGEKCRQHDVLFHVDAAQSAGKLPIDMRAQQIDLLSLNAHKACGPQGIGALVLDTGRIRRVEPQLFGGGQQRGVRPGTLPVHQIVGMGTTMQLLAECMAEEVPRLTALRERLWEGIRSLPGIVMNGHPDQRLCSILNVSVDGVDGESLRFALNDLAVASGSACNSSNGEPSYVLRSLGRTDQQAEASIRFSVGRFSTGAEVDQAAHSFGAAVEFLQSLSPVSVAG